MIKKLLFILLAAVGLQYSAIAQTSTDQRTLTTKIADLLAQLPAKDAKQLNRNMQEISELGEDGYLTLINSLSPAGKGNNSLIEYAIGGYSAYVMQSGKEAQRSRTVRAYCAALNNLGDKQNKQFIISQLELIGKDDAVACLQNYLTDPQLADAASRALVKTNSAAAKAALLKALPQATGPAQLAVIEALGLTRTKEATSALNSLTKSADQNLVKVTLFALANIADPSSAAVISSAAESADYLYNNNDALSANLLYAEKLLKDGNTALATKIAQQLSEKPLADNQIHTRTAALKILMDSQPGNRTAMLLKALDDKNSEYSAAAIKFTTPHLTPSTTSLLLDKLSKLNPVTQAGILNMFAERKSTEALPKVIKLMKSKDQHVKIAAIDATAEIGQAQVFDDLYKVMRKGDSVTIAAVTDALLKMKGDGIAEKVASYIPKSKAPVQIALIKILASRAANEQIGSIYSLLNHKNPAVKQAAYAALKQVATEKDLPALFNLINETNQQHELVEVQDAIIAAVKGNKDNSAQVDMVLQQMSSAPNDKKPLFYKILGSLGGSKSLKAITEAYDSGEGQNKKAALAALASWADDDATEALIKIARETKDGDDFNQALQGYLQLIRKTTYTGAQRLIKLREAMAVAKTTQQKSQILKDMEQAKTFNAMVFAGKYLEDNALQQTAANTVMNIILADASYNGTIVRTLLNKTINVIKGADSEYQKEALRKYLAEMSKEEGFVPLFNGVDLQGWKGLVENPIKRAKMDAKTLAAAQEKADAEMRESWKVENGELKFASKGNNLATVKHYGDFEMLVDWKIIDDKKQNGDAGIYLRGTPQVQIWDNARVKDGAQVGSGGLYNNKVNPSKPLTVADNKLDEWNTFRILMKGDRVTVYLNGVLVTDNVILENFWDRSLPIFAEEQIELQAHGSPIAYRDIYIREIPRAKPFELSAAEKKEGYKVLFDGTNMHHWTGNTADYVIEDGNIAIRPKPGKGSGGNLFSKDQYSDFVFRFEFQLTPGANNGLGIRAPLEGDAAYSGMELQILDNDAPIYKDLHVYQYHGSVYGVMAAKRGFLKPVGEWNYQEVIVKGPKIKVILNGTVILDGDLTEARTKGTADGKSHPGILRSSGHIGFLGHGSPVQFRNIRIKDLSKK
jgi:HEAT repeat protein